jgi:hypothetical protein
MRNRKKITQNYTEKTALEELLGLRKKYVTNENGHQSKIREILQHAQHVLMRLRRNEGMRRKFLKRVRNHKKSRRPDSHEPNLATEVMAKITGTKSRKGLQRAWKYGKVLDILADADVDADKTAAAIKSRGGIEKIVGGAKAKAKAKETPSFANKKAPNSKFQRAVESGDRKLGTITNDKEILYEVFIQLAERDEIRDLPLGTYVTINAIRVEHPRADLKIRRVTKATAPDSDEEQDDEV